MYSTRRSLRSLNHSSWSNICDTLCDLVQFKKREKHPWRSVSFSKVAGFSTFSHILKIVQMVPNCAKHHIFFIVSFREQNKVPVIKLQGTVQRRSLNCNLKIYVKQ